MKNQILLLITFIVAIFATTGCGVSALVPAQITDVACERVTKTGAENNACRSVVHLYRKVDAVRAERESGGGTELVDLDCDSVAEFTPAEREMCVAGFQLVEDLVAVAEERAAD